MMLEEDPDPLLLHPEANANKKKREGRSQNAHAWMECTTRRVSKQESASRSIHPRVKDLIRELLEGGQILFDRHRIWNFTGPDHGFRRLLFNMAARRILNHVQNEENHRQLLEDCRAKFAEWKAQARTRFAEFDWGFSPHDPIWLWLHKSGSAKLIYAGHLRRGRSPTGLQPYLYFSFEIEPAAKPDKAHRVQFTGKAAATSADTVPAGTRSGQRKPRKLHPGLRVMTVDLGMRHLAIATVCEVQEGRVLFPASPARWPAGPGIAQPQGLR